MPAMLSFRRPSDAAESALPRHVGYWVRLDWPDGSHSFVCYIRSLVRAEPKLASLQNYRLRCPGVPVSSDIVVTSRHGWKLHARRGQRRSPDCELPGHTGAGAPL